MTECPRCGAEARGRFCGICGAALAAGSCPACGADVPPGHRYCSECGAEQAGEGPGTGGPASRTGWWVAGAAVAATVLILALPSIWSGWADGGGGPRSPMEGPLQGSPGPAPNVDLSTMTPRQAADRLYDRVMRALSSGDETEVRTFLPMALDAYALARPLDSDGHFHLSLLQQVAGDHEAALVTAEGRLETDTDHLLVLYAAAQAAAELGDAERARLHYQRILDVFDAESERDRPEYREHGAFLPAIREAAREFVEGSG